MKNYAEKVDAYIEKAQPFAKPILNHLRALVHEVCPDVEEKIKWNFPHFDYKGSMMCHMAAFKAHCAFGFWNSAMLPDPDGLLQSIGETAMSSVGKITCLEDLPSDAHLKAWIQAHMELNERGVKLPRGPKKDKEEVQAPADLLEALAQSTIALETFQGFSYSNRKDYVDWIEESKSDETRQKRIAQAVEWMSEGKSRNWKYERK